MNISELQQRVHETAKSKGWHDFDELEWPAIARYMPNWFRSMWFTPRPTARQKLAWLSLVTDEMDEAACESDALYFGPDGKPEGELIEIVDALIRLLDMAGACGWDIARHFDESDKSTYQVHVERTGLVYGIRKDCSMQDERAALLFTAILQGLERARLDASEEKSPPTAEELFALKDEYNRTRSYRHGNLKA